MSESEPELPLEVYRRRLAARRATARRLARFDVGIAWSRLAVFVGSLVLAWLTLRGHHAWAPWLTLTVGTFVLLVIVHDRIIRARERAERAASLYEQGIARIDDRSPAGDGRSARFK